MDLFNKHIANILRAKDEESLAFLLELEFQNHLKQKPLKCPHGEI
ncbi:hypothetical protein [Pectobacterium brasiliense]|nr:hypothetical protein [Pectobacterium brasiliense]